MKRITSAAVLAFLLSVPGARAGVEDLEQVLSTTGRFSADFVQITTDPDGREMDKSSGHVYFSRPDRFRWEYKEPYVQLIVSDGDDVWLYDPDLEQVTVQPLSDQARGPMAVLNGGDLEQAFDVEAGDGEGNLEWFDLRPKGESDFKLIRAGIGNGIVQEMQLVDNFGQETHLSFKDVNRREVLPDSLFRFRPPAGVDVVHAGG